AVGDFNGDGKADLAVAGDSNLSGHLSVRILLGDGDGAFQPPRQTFALGTTPESIAVTDFNGDGKADLAVAKPGDGFFGGERGGSVLLGKGDGTFKEGSGEPGDSSVAVGDFNGDGKADLAVTNARGNSVSVLLGKGDGTFGTTRPIGVGLRPVGLAVQDFNG